MLHTTSCCDRIFCPSFAPIFGRAIKRTLKCDRTHTWQDLLQTYSSASKARLWAFLFSFNLIFHFCFYFLFLSLVFIFIFWYMLGRRSLSLPLITCDSNIEHTLRQLRVKRKSNLPKEHTTNTMAKVPHVALQDHYIPPTYTTPSCLRLSDITATHYEIKPSSIQSLPTFLRLAHENPYNFFSEFQTIYSTIQLTRFTEDALKMPLFIFALKDRAKHWF